MKKTFKYVNENKKKVRLGCGDFDENNVKIVSPNQVATFELDVEEDEVIYVKTWKSKDQVLIATQKDTMWTVGK